MNALLYLFCGLLPIAPLTAPFAQTAAGYRGGGVNALAFITGPKLMLVGLAALLIAHVFLAGDESFLRIKWTDPVVIWGLVFVAVSFASVLNARNLAYVLVTFLRLAPMAAATVLLLCVVRDVPVMERMMIAFFAGSIVLGLMGLYELLTQELVRAQMGFEIKSDPFTFSGKHFRVSGAAGDPTLHGMTFAFPTALAVILILKKGSVITKGIGFLGLALFFVNVLGADSRGAVGAFALALGLTWLLTGMRWKYTIAVIGAVLLVVGLATYLTTFAEHRSRTTGEAGSKTLDYRIGWWRMAIEMAKDRPVLGVGLGNYPENYRRYIASEVPRERYMTHNSFLQVLAESGLLGLTAYVALWGAAVRNAFRARQDPSRHLLANVLLAALIGLLFFANTSNVRDHEIYWFSFALSALLVRDLGTVKARPVDVTVGTAGPHA